MDILNNDAIKRLLDTADPIDFKTTNFSDINLATPENMIQASEQLMNPVEKMKMISESNAAFGNLVTEFNAKYNLDIHINLENLSDALGYIIDPQNKRVLELYTSEFFGRFRVVIYLKMTQAIMILTDQILNPQFLISNSTSYSDKFTIIEKLLQFIASVEEIYSNVKINAADLELKRVNESYDGFKHTDPQVKVFLDAFKNSIKKP